MTTVLWQLKRKKQDYERNRVLKQTDISLLHINSFSLATVFNLTFSKLLFYFLILPPASHSKQIFYIIWLQQNLWRNPGLIRHHEREISLWIQQHTKEKYPITHSYTWEWARGSRANPVFVQKKSGTKKPFQSQTLQREVVVWPKRHILLFV